MIVRFVFLQAPEDRWRRQDGRGGEAGAKLTGRDHLTTGTEAYIDEAWRIDAGQRYDVIVCLFFRMHDSVVAIWTGGV